MISRSLGRKSLVALAALAFAAAWFYLTRELFLIALRLGPAARAGEPAALVLVGLALPWAVFLAQGLFYVRPRRSGPPVFIQPAGPSGPLLCLLLPLRTALTTGPALEIICSPGDREKLLQAARNRFRLSFCARLALLLQARTPLDRLLKGPAERSWPLVGPIARLLYLLLSPVRQFLYCWGYLFFRLWRAWEDPGPVDQLSTYKQALAGDLVFRAGAEASPEDLRRVWADLAHIYAHPDYGYELGEPEPPLPPERADAENRLQPWLAPRYRGLYLDLPVTWAAGSLDELYDDGPEEKPDRFYPPELGLEVELTARLTAERRRLAQALEAGRAEGLIWLDGRLYPVGELEYAIWDLDDRLWQEKKRLAAHHRRCRSSHLARARRLGRGWPELLTAILARLFMAERERPDWRDEALTALLAAEEALVHREAALKPDLPWPAYSADPAFPSAPPARPEPPARVRSEAASLNTGFGRGLLTLGLLGLLIWQGGVLGRSRLTIYNGLARELVVMVDGRRLAVDPLGQLNLSIPPGRECRIETRAGDGRLVESFQQRLHPVQGREVYNIGGAAPLMEWPAGPATGSSLFLGRPRWLRSEAEVLFREPSGPELGRGVRVLSAYGEDPPGTILEAFADESDQDALIRLHARWDEPDSPWFWHWQVLLIGRTDWLTVFLDRIEHEPDFLERGLARFDRNDTLGTPAMNLPANAEK